MRGFVPPDPEGGVSNVEYAVVYAPKLNLSGRNRKRFSANCVEIKESAEEAHAGADEKEKRYAAKVLGPSKSSEGQFIFYLVEWLIPNRE
ncbi:MAG: hypothetical protein HKN83_09975 [Gammaproteobacteria bacterium]|nr:hypothetical protein [Gammaproteobacteria bacterium]